MRTAYLLLSVLTAAAAHLVLFCGSGAAAPQAGATAETTAAEAKLEWSDFTSDIFERARRENKLVLLDLEAVWCHWCHVMHRETYGNSAVASAIVAHYIPVRVDQDSRPDLANRYRDYGWPATIIFSKDGEELVKRAGYIPPEQMTALLNKTAQNPVSEKADSQSQPAAHEAAGALSEELRKELTARYERTLDTEKGGLRIAKRYLDADTVEFGMWRALSGGESDRSAVRLTLDSNLKLIDPVWGGAYQYSTHSDWDHPHFEKILSTQARGVRLYAMAYRLWRDDDYREAARAIFDYTRKFLRAESGAFYVSQDADVVRGEHAAQYFSLNDAERRTRGIPAVDRNEYARENGWMLRALAEYYAATGDDHLLHEARRTGEWLLGNRKLASGGFRHGSSDTEAGYLDDTLAAAEGLLALYSVSGERRWLTAASEAAGFMITAFRSKTGAGYVTSTESAAAPLTPLPVVDENIRAARFFNLLHHYTGRTEFTDAAKAAMGYLADPSVALRYMTEPGIIMADLELAKPPLHVTVVGPKQSAESLALFQEALRVPSLYRRTEWWDRTAGPMPNPDVEYPELPRPAAFICTDSRCSLPIFKPEDLTRTIQRLSATGAQSGPSPNGG